MRLPTSSEVPTPSGPAPTLPLCLAHPQDWSESRCQFQVGLLAPERTILEPDALGQAYPYVSKNDFVTRRANPASRVRLRP